MKFARSRSFVASALVVAGLAGSFTAATVSTASASVAHAASCSIVTSAIIKSDLGLKVAAPKSVDNLGDIHCDYAIGSNPLGVQISFLPESYSTFQQVAKAYTGSGDKVLSGIGQYAFAASIHTTGSSASDVYFYAHGYDIAVGAVAPLSSVEKVAKLLATKA